MWRGKERDLKASTPHALMVIAETKKKGGRKGEQGWGEKERKRETDREGERERERDRERERQTDRQSEREVHLSLNSSILIETHGNLRLGVKISFYQNTQSGRKLVTL